MAEEKEDVNFSKEKTDIENGNGEWAMPVNTNRLFPIYHEPTGKSLFPAVEPDLQTGYPVFFMFRRGITNCGIGLVSLVSQSVNENESLARATEP